MVYPSGEVETCGLNDLVRTINQGSGWFIRPGKLKQVDLTALCGTVPLFRMVYPSGEVETVQRTLAHGVDRHRFRMVYPSGEVETSNMVMCG